MRKPDPNSKTQTRSPAELEPHPAADLIPVMSEADFAAFVADIGAHEVLVPIEITSENVVLDGRQRLRAARELGLEHVPVRVVAVEDALEYMLRAAILRRHLTASQRGALVVELSAHRQLREQGKRRQRANLRQAPEEEKLPPRGRSRDQAARWAGVSPRTVQDAITVREHDAAAFERVKRGEVKLDVVARRIRRRLRDRALPLPPPPPEGPFELIYADPPWQLGHPDSPHAPENHYPTLPLEQLKTLSVPAAENAVLFLWVVTALVPEALELVKAWRFEYRSACVWDKGSIGPGIWFRNQHEQLLLAIRGDWHPAEPEDRFPSVIHAKRRRHSQKPVVFYELIERMYPQASKLELFARGKSRPGWAAWGNEVEP